MARIVLVHGFNVRDGGAQTVDRLAPFLEAAGYTVDKDEADYGWFGLLAVRIRKYYAVRRIVNALHDADVIISHSNGSNYEHKALALLEHRKKAYQIIRLSPALNSSTGVTVNVATAAVFHTHTDWITWLSGLLWFHPWGRQGQKGYTGDDRRIVNYDYTDLILNHSDWFKDGNIEIVAADIIEFLKR